ncbi:MAG: type II secretion system F family protein [Boseongicola sp.]
MSEFLAAYGTLIVNGLLFAAYFIGFAFVMSFGIRWILNRGMVVEKLDHSKRAKSLEAPGADLAVTADLHRRPHSKTLVDDFNRTTGFQLNANFVLLSAALVLTIGASIYLINRNIALAFAGAVIISFIVLSVTSGWSAARRLRRFESQLPEALDTIVRSLRAGHPTTAAIQMVAREFPKPLGDEFEILSNEITYGLDLETAMRNMAARVRLHDLGMIVSAIALHARSGGNLSEILTNLAGVIRERMRLRLKVRALSAEGRFSAITLSLLPFILFGALSLVAPGFYGAVWGNPLIYPIFIGAGIWMGIGNLIMWRMVNIET